VSAAMPLTQRCGAWPWLETGRLPWRGGDDV
jgi:hypothetical protein